MNQKFYDITGFVDEPIKCWQSQNVLYRIQIFGENNTKVLSMLQGTAKDLLSDVSL